MAEPQFWTLGTPPSPLQLNLQPAVTPPLARENSPKLLFDLQSLFPIIVPSIRSCDHELLRSFLDYLDPSFLRRRKQVKLGEKAHDRHHAQSKSL